MTAYSSASVIDIKINIYGAMLLLCILLKSIFFVGFDVPTAVVMKGSVFYDITLSSPMTVNLQRTTRCYIPEDRILLSIFLISFEDLWLKIILDPILAGAWTLLADMSC
jgi:hypothetical protein